MRRRVKLAGGYEAHLVVDPGEMATALCGVHPFWPGTWMRQETAQLPLCSGCEGNAVDRMHATEQADAVGRCEAGLYTALAARRVRLDDVLAEEE